VIRLCIYSDFVTNQQLVENTDTVQPDGFFELAFQSDYIQPVTLKIDNLAGSLYVTPDYVYGVTIPPVREERIINKDVELPLNIGIVGADSTELNMRIFDYLEAYNKLFLKEDNRYISRASIFKLADSLQKICDQRFRHVANSYFKSYVLYSIGAINASVSRGEKFLINGYILNKPIQYHHHEYMQFFNACFKGYLNAMASAQPGQSLYKIVNDKASLALLDNFARADQFLKANDTLREFVLIKNLWDFYYSPDFNRAGVESILTQINERTRIKEHKQVLETMIAYINKMQVGSLAPDFIAKGRDGKPVRLSAYKGHWIYLNFFSTSNTGSLKEMLKIAGLKKKYGDKVSFISVCIDDSIKTYYKYLRANPKLDWLILYNYDRAFKKTAKDNYFVTGNEAYFLISNTGYIAQAPAILPSKGIEYKFNVLFRVKTRTTKTGIR
jgi:thiol-disulfide isomerase/thioredoxin